MPAVANAVYDLSLRIDKSRSADKILSAEAKAAVKASVTGPPVSLNPWPNLCSSAP